MVHRSRLIDRLEFMKVREGARAGLEPNIEAHGACHDAEGKNHRKNLTQHRLLPSVRQSYLLMKAS